MSPRLLGNRLSQEPPLLLSLGETEGAIWLLVDVALLEHLVDLLLHAAHLMEVVLSRGHFLLHLLEAPHFLGDFGLLSLLLELLFLDLGSGLPSLGTWLHQMAGLALRNYRQHVRWKDG